MLVRSCGDAKAAAKALTALLAGKTLACDASKAERAAQIKAEKAAWEKELDAWTHEKDPFSLDMIEENGKEKPFSGGEYLHPRQVLRELEKAMPPRAMVSTDIGNINSVANSYLRFEEPRSFFAPMSFGNCGYALPTIIGAKAAAMDRPAISYAGDGAWGMSMGEIMTCVRHNIPVTAVVFHNRQWGAEKKNFDTALKVGKPVARKVAELKPAHIASECPLAGDHIVQGVIELDKDAKPPMAQHPILLFAKAYGIDVAR